MIGTFLPVPIWTFNSILQNSTDSEIEAEARLILWTSRYGQNFNEQQWHKKLGIASMDEDISEPYFWMALEKGWLFLTNGDQSCTHISDLAQQLSQDQFFIELFSYETRETDHVLKNYIKAHGNLFRKILRLVAMAEERCWKPPKNQNLWNMMARKSWILGN